jgi:hypothetical protein
MKKSTLLCLCLLLAVCPASARTVDRDNNRFLRDIDTPRLIEPVQSDHHIPELGIFPRVSANVETTFSAYYTWDNGGVCDPQGWRPLDKTAQTHEFWHVAGVSELDGGSFGNLVPLEGAQSMWCGVDGPVTVAEDLVLCGYAVLPGYGNNWDQALCLRDCLTGAGGVEVDVAVMWDSETDYDATTLEADNCDENWVAVYGGLGTWDGSGTDTLAIAVSDTLHSGSLRLRFRFESDGAWSDQDGLHDSDGAFLLDQLAVSDTSGVRVAYEDFEDEAPGAHESDDWVSCNPPGYGDFSGLFPGSSLVQEDDCQSELDCVWAFIKGSTANYACGGWPEQAAVPYVNERDQYISNWVYSPDIDVTGSGGSVWEIVVDVYRDLQLDALVGWGCMIRSIGPDGCPGLWGGPEFLSHHWGGRDWLRARWGVGQYIDPGATHVNIALGVRDYCEFWCGVWGTGSCHSHAPLYDDLEFYRVRAVGPVFGGRDIDMFQDNFATDGTNTGTARADMAQDVLPSTSAGVRPGDSVLVNVTAPEGMGYHLSGETSSGAAVYFYCSVDGPNAGAAGPSLVDDTRYNYVGTVTAGGRTWFQIQMDSTWTRFGELVEDRYNIDLNDNLFVPGDTVWFFFGADDASDLSTYWALTIPTQIHETDDIDLAASNPDEFTILPAEGVANGGDILYVDGMNFRGSQPFFDTAFESLGILDLVDRYDVRGPSSAVGNHPGARVQAASQLYSAYSVIVWTCGDLETVFADGSGTPDKSDDTGLLFNFLDNLPGSGPPGGGVYLNGDDVADKWLNVHTSASSTQLSTKYMNFSLAAADHVPIVGISPLVVGEPTSLFRDGFGVDTMVVYGGCPLINDFDMINAEGTAELEMSYHGNSTAGGAILSQLSGNAVGNTVGFVLSGFSYHYIRDVTAGQVMARTEHMHRILAWLNSLPVIPIPVEPQRITRNELRQNHPNPFNPVTTIRYQVKTTGPVTLRIYNVAGQLVRTLVSETVEAGRIHDVNWRGQNDSGLEVSSGVYFYRLVTGEYTQTRKMVLLK